ncbi:methyl-accepting chemotaxis protein [Methylocapsa sp. S129]|uniref:methyl-accepting chemotaxis protein n=1 Tax=Methylocapsa sp. S129 TaxID=1641869 RepID=UPI00131B7EF9|nr:methyl-accepting chemotaxis protein [Methylocapsa sp. S129]
MNRPAFDLAALRRRALSLLLVLSWLQAALIALACWFVDCPWLIPVGASVAFAATAQAMARFDAKGDQSRLVSGVSLMASISIMVGVMSGQKMQVDLHMVYFAALAILVACCDWRVIVAGTAVVALHHTALNFVLPNLVYPGGEDFGRLLLHAIVLSIEAAALVWVAITIERMFGAVSQEAAHAEQSRLMAEQSHDAALAAAREAETARARNEQDRARVMQDDETILNNLALSLRRLAEGDLTATLDVDLPEKAEGLRADLNATVRSLRSVMQAVVRAAAGVRASANEISTAASNLSGRTEQQAANLEETAAALDQITATVRRTAEGAARAHAVVGAARTDAEHSGQVVRQAIAAMSAIESSSSQIGQIIGVIDEIAFQTNLLALNAGVEAARAGDAGRGFAVVATEVRTLAQRSTEAAKEIKALISASAGHVGHGVKLVAQTGAVLARIVEQVNEINRTMAEIAASSGEQAKGLDQVNSAVNQMDQTTQQNAAMVGESTAATQTLVQEAEELSRAVDRFKVGQAGMDHSLSARPRPALASSPVRALKTVGRGGAAWKPA